MKKLMVALAAVAVAATVQAASAVWNSGTLTMPSGGEAGSGDVTGYLFVLTATEYAALTSSQDVIDKYSTKLGDAYQSAASGVTGTIKLTDNSKAYAKDETSYTAIIYVAHDNGVDYFKGNYGEVTFTSTSNKTVANMASTGGHGATANWAAAPEPTSGLLLLLGVAGLALRRKRA